MKYFVYIVLIINLLGCQKVIKNKTPSHFLTEQEMTTILYDIALIKSSKANFFDYFNNSGISPEEYLCYKYNVDQIMLEENISYYSYEPENIKKIYQSIKDSLERKEKYLEQIVENKKALLLAQQREEDSLMNAELIKDTIKDSIQ